MAAEPLSGAPTGDEAGFVVARRFRGPPRSGNGGYVAGRLAAALGGPAAVRLHAPPPLDVPLAVRRHEGRVRLERDGAVVAEARRVELALEAPAPPASEEARAAAQAFRGFEAHVFPACFVCGPERGDGDGLRIFPGPVAGRDLVAAPWTPDPSLDAGDGRVAEPFLWAALDCPGAFAFPQPDRVVLLGELAVRLEERPETGEPCVVVGWETARDGRKHHTGTALFGREGRLYGVGRAIWLEVEPARAGAPLARR